MPECALDTRARSGIHRSTLYYQIPLATLSLGATDSFPGSHARCVCATRVRDSAPSTGPVVAWSQDGVPIPQGASARVVPHLMESRVSKSIRVESLSG